MNNQPIVFAPSSLICSIDTTGGEVEAYSQRDDIEENSSIQETEAHLNLTVSDGDTIIHRAQTEPNTGLAVLDIDAIRKNIEGLLNTKSYILKPPIAAPKPKGI